MGTNEIANPNVDSNIGILDELGQESLQQQKDALKKEIEVFTQNKADLLKGKENYEKQWLVDKRILELQIEGNNLKPMDPKTPLEANDEYYELIKQKVGFKLRMDTFNAEQQLLNYDKQMEVMQEQIDSSLAKLKELEE